MNIILKTRDREDQTADASNCSVLLGQAIEGKYMVSNLVIMNNFYTIDSSNNKLYFYENNTSKIATLTTGYYSDTTMPTMIKTVMNAASSLYNSYVITLDVNTKKFTFSASNLFKFEFSKSTGNDCAEIIGAYRFKDTDLNTGIICPFARDFSSVKAVLIQISQSTGSEYITLSDRFNKHILGNIYIPMNVNFGEIKYVNSLMDNPTYINFSSTNRINIKVLDVSNGSIRPMNGAEIIIALKRC